MDKHLVIDDPTFTPTSSYLEMDFTHAEQPLLTRGHVDFTATISVPRGGLVLGCGGDGKTSLLAEALRSRLVEQYSLPLVPRFASIVPFADYAGQSQERNYVLEELKQAGLWHGYVVTDIERLKFRPYATTTPELCLDLEVLNLFDPEDAQVRRDTWAQLLRRHVPNMKRDTCGVAIDMPWKFHHRPDEDVAWEWIEDDLRLSLSINWFKHGFNQSCDSQLAIACRNWMEQTNTSCESQYTWWSRLSWWHSNQFVSPAVWSEMIQWRGSRSRYFVFSNCPATYPIRTLEESRATISTNFEESQVNHWKVMKRRHARELCKHREEKSAAAHLSNPVKTLSTLDSDTHTDQQALSDSDDLRLLRGLAKHREVLVQSRLEEENVAWIGDELNILRKRARVSRDQFANQLGIDLALLVALENGFGDPETAVGLLEKARQLIA